MTTTTKQITTIDCNWEDLVRAQVSLAVRRLRESGRVNDANVLADAFSQLPRYAVKRIAVMKRKAWRKLCLEE